MNEELDLEQVEQEIEVSIEAAKGAVDRKNKIAKMFDDDDFKEIVEEGYFKNEAARLVSLLTDPEFAGEERQTELKNDMLGISSFRQYLLNMHRIGVQMENQIKTSEDELIALRNEQEGE